MGQYYHTSTLGSPPHPNPLPRISFEFYSSFFTPERGYFPNICIYIYGGGIESIGFFPKDRKASDGTARERLGGFISKVYVTWMLHRSLHGCIHGAFALNPPSLSLAQLRHSKLKSSLKPTLSIAPLMCFNSRLSPFSINKGFP